MLHNIDTQALCYTHSQPNISTEEVAQLAVYNPVFLKAVDALHSTHYVVDGVLLLLEGHQAEQVSRLRVMIVFARTRRSVTW